MAEPLWKRALLAREIEREQGHALTRRQLRRESNVCTECVRPAESGYTKCAHCLERIRVRRRECRTQH